MDEITFFTVDAIIFIVCLIVNGILKGAKIYDSPVEEIFFRSMIITVAWPIVIIVAPIILILYGIYYGSFKIGEKIKRY